MSTPILYHGPLGRDAAVDWSYATGRPVADPIGDNGLKVDDSRLIVSVANQAGIGDLPPTLVIGPVDRATPEAADALLKTLEDLAGGPLRLVLWADFLGGVTQTIRSRVITSWCPGEISLPKSILASANSIVKASRPNSSVVLVDAICLALDAHDPELLLHALITVLDPTDSSDIGLWDRIRPMLGSKWVASKTAFLDTLLP